MKTLEHNLITVANAFKIEFINFYLGVSCGNFTTCYPHARLLYSLECASPAILDDGKAPVHFFKGRWLFIPPSVTVKHLHDRSRHLSIHFNCAPGFMGVLQYFDSLQSGQADELQNIVEAMQPEDPISFVNSAEYVVRYVLACLLRSRGINGRQLAELSLRYQELTDWLKKKSDLGITVAEMAHFMHLGEQTFARKFAAEMHTTPRKFNEKLLINQAIKLLAAPDLTIKDIADALNFCDEYHFSRVFKRNTLLPPGAFRKKLLKGQWE